ncbi:MAG: glycosyltransferase, partial [Myxococcaceae bacterium]
VVPVERPHALAQAMVRLLKDPGRAKEMGLAARRFVERELTLGKMISAHDALFRELVHPGA